MRGYLGMRRGDFDQTWKIPFVIVIFFTCDLSCKMGSSAIPFLFVRLVIIFIIWDIFSCISYYLFSIYSNFVACSSSMGVGLSVPDPFPALWFQLFWNFQNSTSFDYHKWFSCQMLFSCIRKSLSTPNSLRGLKIFLFKFQCLVRAPTQKEMNEWMHSKNKCMHDANAM